MSSAAIVFLILVISFALLVSGRLKPDIVAVLVLLALVFTSVIEPAQAFVGFSSFAVVTIAALMIIGDGLEKTGVVDWVAKKLEKVIRKRYGRLLLVNTAVPGVLSGFINIVAAASFFIPVILRLCKEMGVAQSRILLPMACAALMGANLTLIGASHNLVVHSLLEEAQGTGFAFFEFTVIGAVLVVAVIVYTFVIGQHLLPGREEVKDPEQVPVTARLIDVYRLEDRLFEIWVGEEIEEGDSPFTIGDLRLGTDHDLELVTVVREGDHLKAEDHDTVLEGSDMLLVQGREADAVALAEQHEALTFMGPPEVQEKYPLSTAELAEAVVPPRSPAVGRTPRELRLSEEYGLRAIAYYRDGEPHLWRARDTQLREGDSLLFYGPRAKMREFTPENELLVYFKPGDVEVTSEKRHQAPWAAAILAAVILVAALGWFPIAVSALAGATAMVLSGIVDWKRLYDAVDWKTLVLIAGMYPLGTALNQSGGAQLIGDLLVGHLGDFGPLAVLAGISLLCMLLTQPMHNAAVAIIMTPIAITAANAMDSSATGFCVAVVISSSATFLLPYGHPAPFLVQEPGDYTIGDYMRFGIGLNVITLAVVLGLIPVFWPI
jgi:di/tricarboxylate transporter